MSERYSVVFSLRSNLYAEGSPVIISAGNLLKDNKTGGVLAQLKIRSIAEKKIKAAVVEIHSFDTIGKPLDATVRHEYLDLSVAAGEEFGQKTAIKIPDASARGLEVRVTAVAFDDNSVWEGSDAPWEPLPTPSGLDELSSDAELVKQYELKVGRCDYLPKLYKDIWQCSCGTWNRTPSCTRCANVKTKLLPIDIDALSAERDARLAREKAEREAKEAAEREAAEAAAEAARRRKEKAKKATRIIGAIAAGLCVLALLTYLIGWHLIPFIRYRGAIKKIENQAFDEAYETFVALGDYRDSAAQANEALYQKGMFLLDKGAFTEAIELFRSIETYSDSKAQEGEGYYCLATQQFEAKQYDLAYKNYTTAVEKAGVSNSSGKLRDYKDSNERAKESLYHFAMERFDSGDYQKAYPAFKQIEDYKDVSERLPEAKYQYALTLVTKKDWEGAAKLFKQLEDYQDSVERYKDTYYQYGLQKLGSKNFIEAISVFSSLENYQESKSKLNEAKYGYVLAHKSRSDNATYMYLKDLTAVGYKDSKTIYQELYAWKAKIVINKSETDEKNHKSYISKYGKVYCHVSLSGGHIGEKIEIRYAYTWPGSTTNSNDLGKWGDGYSGGFSTWYDSPTYAKTGTFRVRIYNKATGELLGEASTTITN